MSTAIKNQLICAGLVLGIGFGGLADGIVLHQILGWHHLVCHTVDCQPLSVAQLQREGMQDGYFHLALWLVLLVGTAMLFRASRLAGWAGQGRVLVGAMLAGCGLFNFTEGLIDHQWLGIHHVLPGSPHERFFDLLWLEIGALLCLVGARVMRTPKI